MLAAFVNDFAMDIPYPAWNMRRKSRAKAATIDQVDEAIGLFIGGCIIGLMWGSIFLNI